jgi:hypothetical protein
VAVTSAHQAVTEGDEVVFRDRSGGTTGEDDDGRHNKDVPESVGAEHAAHVGSDSPDAADERHEHG